MAEELQVIPARHGMATFVPAGQTIKIINTSGTQVIDTWAFALPKPDEKGAPEQIKEEKQDEQKQDQNPQSPSENAPTPQKAVSKKKGKRGSELPSQEDAEEATQEGMKKAESASNQVQNQAQNQAQTPQKSSWSSYVPSLGLTSSGKKSAGGEVSQKNETEQQKNSRTWASYIPSGKGFSSYIPKSASDTVTAFAQDVSPTDEQRGSRPETLTADSTSET